MLPLALASLLASTTIPTLSAQELVARSDVVAEVIVRSHEAAWVGEKILTFYEVDVVGAPWVARAEPSSPSPGVIHLRVAFPGGVVGDIGQAVPGTPVLDDGATYVLCMSRPVGPRDARVPIGLWQGVWRVDAAGKVRAFAHGGAVAGPAAAPVDVDALRAALVPR